MDEDGVVAEHVIINLTKDEALVLFEWLSRQNGADLNLGHLGLVDLAERNVLWSLHGALERTLAETFLPEYGDIIESARRRLHPSE